VANVARQVEREALFVVAARLFGESILNVQVIRAAGVLTRRKKERDAEAAADRWPYRHQTANARF